MRKYRVFDDGQGNCTKEYFIGIVIGKGDDKWELYEGDRINIGDSDYFKGSIQFIKGAYCLVTDENKHVYPFYNWEDSVLERMKWIGTIHDEESA